jgi:hypothetical protein
MGLCPKTNGSLKNHQKTVGLLKVEKTEGQSGIFIYVAATTLR